MWMAREAVPSSQFCSEAESTLEDKVGFFKGFPLKTVSLQPSVSDSWVQAASTWPPGWRQCPDPSSAPFPSGASAALSLWELGLHSPVPCVSLLRNSGWICEESSLSVSFHSMQMRSRLGRHQPPALLRGGHPAAEPGWGPGLCQLRLQPPQRHNPHQRARRGPGGRGCQLAVTSPMPGFQRQPFGPRSISCSGTEISSRAWLFYHYLPLHTA